MSKFSLEWFKSKKGKKLAKLLIEEQSMINELIKKEVKEKPYKKLKLVNDVLTVVLNNGDVISKPSCSVHDFQEVANAKTEADVIELFGSTKFYKEREKEIINTEKAKAIGDNFHLLKQLSDFDVSESSVKLKGINRTMPQLLVEKFVEVVGRQLPEPNEDLQTVCNEDVEYVALKRFFMWCCLNPRAEVADKLYDFLMSNSFRITKQGFFVALRNVVTVHGSNELVKFVSETYTKVKAVWKKSPSDYHVIMFDEGGYTMIHKDQMFTTITEKCPDCDGTGNTWDEEYDRWETCWNCNDNGEVTSTEKNYVGTDLGILTDLYLDLPNRAENRFTDDWTKTFDIRIGKIVNMPMEECNWSTQDCAASGLKYVAS